MTAGVYREREVMTAPVAALERRRLRPQRAEQTAKIGMAIFLGSWAMLFAGLFFAYAFVRARAPAWPPPDAPALPKLIPALNTLALLGASALVARAVRLQHLGRAVPAWRHLAVAAALGAAFLALQVRVWGQLWHDGLVLSDSPYSSVFYSFTAFHALHVLVGIAALTWLAARARSGGEGTRVAVRLWGWYWHFVGAVWIALYTTVYLA